MKLDEIIQQASEKPFCKETVGDFCSQANLTVPAFCDEVSKAIATRYHEGSLTYEFCDMVMNHLSSFILSERNECLPEYADSVYLAFDAGEYRHQEDPPGSSSEELHTKPMIANIIAKARPGSHPQ